MAYFRMIKSEKPHQKCVYIHLMKCLCELSLCNVVMEPQSIENILVDELVNQTWVRVNT